MVVFASAVSGVAAAVEMQQAIARYNRTQDGADGAAFSVRVGLHVGDPIEDEGDYFGTPVVTAARLCDAAGGGQILASTLVETLVAGRAGITCKPAGAVPCRGAAKPIDAVDVLWDTGPQHLTPLPPPLVHAMAAPAMPMMGRDVALGRLHGAWAAVRDGGRAMALVSGEPGIGKTRLLAELARLVHDGGGTVLYGRCDEGLEFPLQPFVQALRDVVDLRPPVPDADPERRRYVLFETVDRELSRLSEDAPVLLVLDDLHWADPASLQLLRHLGRHPSSRVMVAGAYRDVETGPRHPLHAAVADLVENGSVTTVALAGLTPTDVDELVADLGRAPLDDAGRAAAARLHEMSGGNPTLALEMFTHLFAAGAVAVRDGKWTYEVCDVDDALPAAVQELIERRLRRLSHETNRILTLASVVGRDFALDIVEQVSDCPPAAVLEAVEEGVAARLIAEINGAFARYRFQHPLVHQTLFRRTSLARRDRLRRRLLEVSERLGTL
jgi:predicted ATPase